MLANLDQFFNGLTDSANIKAVATSLSTLLGQLQTVDWATESTVLLVHNITDTDEISTYRTTNTSVVWNDALRGLQDSVDHIAALFPVRARPASRGVLDPMPWILDFLDGDLNQIITQTQQSLTALQGVDWSSVCAQFDTRPHRPTAFSLPLPLCTLAPPRGPLMPHNVCAAVRRK
jgi:hypothetical protein